MSSPTSTTPAPAPEHESADATQLYGYPEHTLEDNLIDVSRTVRQTAQFFTTPGSLMAAFALIVQQRRPSRITKYAAQGPTARWRMAGRRHTT